MSLATDEEYVFDSYEIEFDAEFTDDNGSFYLEE